MQKQHKSQAVADGSADIGDPAEKRSRDKQKAHTLSPTKNSEDAKRQKLDQSTNTPLPPDKKQDKSGSSEGPAA